MKVLTVTLNPSLDREIIVENFEVGKLFRVSNPHGSIMDPGGKGINVSIMLASLGIESIATGILGGHIGRIVHTKLLEIDKITSNFVFIEGETRENITLADPVKHQITEINSAGPYVNEEDFEHFFKRYKNTVSFVEHIVVSGSVPPGITVDQYKDIFRYAKKKGKTTYIEAIGPFFDSVVKELTPMVVRPDLRREQKVLNSELRDEKDYVEAAKKIISYGAKLVIMSYHVVGDIIATQEGIWLFVAAEEIDYSHLLGAGDAFVAGIVYYIIKFGYDYFNAAKFGMASAIAKTHYLEKRMAPLEEIEKSLSKFTIKRID